MKTQMIATVRISSHITAQGLVLANNPDGTTTIDAGQARPVKGLRIGGAEAYRPA